MKGPTDAGLLAIAEGCKGMKEIKLSVNCSQLDDVTIADVVQRCTARQIRTLDFVGYHHYQAGDSITRKGLLGFADRCPGLTSISLSDARDMSDARTSRNNRLLRVMQRA